MATQVLATLLLSVLPTQGEPPFSPEASPALSINGARSRCDTIDRLALTGAICICTTLATPLLATAGVTALLAVAVLPLGAWAPILVVALGAYLWLTLVLPSSTLAAIPAWLVGLMINLVLFYNWCPGKASQRSEGDSLHELPLDEKAQQTQLY